MKERLNKEERELLTGLAIQYGVGIIPEALDAIEQLRGAATKDGQRENAPLRTDTAAKRTGGKQAKTRK